MRDNHFSHALKISTIGHISLVLAFLLISSIAHFFKPREPRDAITMIELVQPSLSIPTPSLPTPEPEPSEPEEPEPQPEEKDTIPIKTEPKKEEPKPKLATKNQIKVSTNKVKRATSTPPNKNQPKLSEAEIRKLLASGIPASSSGGSVGNASEMDWYYALVRADMYEAWEQPSGAGTMVGLVAQVSINVMRDGTITSRSLSRSSGNSTMDASVMKAVNRVYRLKPLPGSFSGSSKNITIDFELTRTGM